MTEVQRFAATFHAVDSQLYPAEYKHDVDRFGEDLAYVPIEPVFDKAEGRLVADDPDTGLPINDVWGLFVSNVLFRRGEEGFDRDAMMNHYDELLSLLPTAVTEEEKLDAFNQAETWNEWTEQLRNEIEERDVRGGTAGLFSLTDDLSRTTAEPTPSPGTTTPPPELDPEDEIDAWIRKLLTFIDGFVLVERQSDAFFAGDGKAYKNSAEAKALFEALDRADVLPDSVPDETKLDRLATLAADLDRSLTAVNRALEAFKLAHLDDKSVEDFTRIFEETLGD